MRDTRDAKDVAISEYREALAIIKLSARITNHGHAGGFCPLCRIRWVADKALKQEPFS